MTDYNSSSQDAQPVFSYDNDRMPVITLAELDALDEAEMVEGYWDGYNGEPEPGGNRSKAYWHGWRNGAVDGKHREADWAQAELARVVVASRRKF